MSPVAPETAAMTPAGRAGSAGPRGLELRLTTDPATAGLTPAFAPGLFTSRGQHALDLAFRAGTIGSAAIAEADWNVPAHLAEGRLVRARTDGGQRWFDPATGMASILERGRGEVIVNDPAAVPGWALSNPGLRVIDMWASRHGMLAAHASAFAFGNRAVLCLGPGGSGKTTLSVEAALAGLGFLGDDYVLADPGDGACEPVVQGLYRSAKLLPDRLPQGLTQAPWLPCAADADKHIYLMPDAMCLRIASLAAVVLPHVALADRPAV